MQFLVIMKVEEWRSYKGSAKEIIKKRETAVAEALTYVRNYVEQHEIKVKLPETNSIFLCMVLEMSKEDAQILQVCNRVSAVTKAEAQYVSV